MGDLFIMDTSALLDAKDYYPPELFESFWDYLIEMTTEGEMIIIDKVVDEIGRGSDFLSDDFIKAIKVENSEKIEYINVLKEIMGNIDPSVSVGWRSWVRKADPWVIAVARYHQLSTLDNPIVIHNEVERGKQLKIETECKRLGIENGRIHRIIKDKKIKFGVI